MTPDFDAVILRARAARRHSALLDRARAARIDAAVRRELIAQIAVENAIVRIRCGVEPVRPSPETAAALRRTLCSDDLTGDERDSAWS